MFNNFDNITKSATHAFNKKTSLFQQKLWRLDIIKEATILRAFKPRSDENTVKMAATEWYYDICETSVGHNFSYFISDISVKLTFLPTTPHHHAPPPAIKQGASSTMVRVRRRDPSTVGQLCLVPRMYCMQ